MLDLNGLKERFIFFLPGSAPTVTFYCFRPTGLWRVNFMHKQQINTCDMTLKKNSAQWLRLLTPEGAVDHKLKSLQGRWPCWVCGWLLAGLQPQCQALPACPHKPRCCHQQREPAACCLSTSLHNTASIGGGVNIWAKAGVYMRVFSSPTVPNRHF